MAELDGHCASQSNGGEKRPRLFTPVEIRTMTTTLAEVQAKLEEAVQRIQRLEDQVDVSGDAAPWR
jgi:hypothetical protein